MRKFYGVAQYDNYRVGCAGQTVYVSDGQGAEIARLKDISYAYAAAFSPDGSLLAVRSTTACFAFYAPPEFQLVQKVRMRRPNNQPQDEGFCFSPDGSLFWSLEYQNDLTTHLVQYDTKTFAETGRFFENERYVFSHIEPNAEGGYDLLGFRREPEAENNSHRLARFDDEQIVSQMPLADSVYERAHRFKKVELCGFTEQMHEIWMLKERFSVPVPLGTLCGGTINSSQEY